MPWVAKLATVTIQLVASKLWSCVVLGTSLLAGCTSSGSAALPTTSVPPAEVPGATPIASAPHVEPEPTGVPGLSASDPFCAAWAAYAGTLQTIGVAASFGDLPTDRLAALELTAAQRLFEITAAIDSAWPSELAAEHDVVIDQRIGPYARRAGRAVEALRNAGVTATELDLLSSAWQTSLAHRDPRIAVIELPAVPEALQAKIDAAAIAYDQAVTPFAEDPSLLIENVSAPATSEYLAAHCPDLASIGVGDAL
jgi:hypothetical protein